MSASYSVGIVIPAGGRGTRFGAQIPKQFLDLLGTPIIVRSVRAALAASNVTCVVISVQQESREELMAILREHDCQDPRLVLVDGGVERHHSVARGLEHPSMESLDVILIHDAVRPLASVALFDRVAQAAMTHGAVIPVIAVPDTLKRITPDGVVVATIDRSEIRRAQTPQGFFGPLIRAVYSDAMERERAATDCASLCEQAGVGVHVVEGEETNIKVTTPFDLQIACTVMRASNQPDA
jgi:2-C-methyl-D-erythritol 4-phosphate cytidylyltransferase